MYLQSETEGKKKIEFDTQHKLCIIIIIITIIIITVIIIMIIKNKPVVQRVW